MSLLQEAIIYLVAAIIAVPISKRLGFGSVLGYLAAGIIIGPFGLRFIRDPEHILHFAELGVVFLLFIIGLELQPSRLWVLRRMVFGLGSTQVVLSAIVIGLLAWTYGFTPTAAAVSGLILALSSTAFVLQLLAEKKQLTTTHGRAAFSILLFQDLAVIPLIALLPLIGSGASGENQFDPLKVGITLASIAGLIIGGHFLLRPLFRIVAQAKLPELFTATALLVVIGAALFMQFAGLSMVLGAFIAGMLLADSEYRHELEADLAPFKGLLLGLFFIAVGMSVNIGLLLKEPMTILLFVVGLMVAKAIVLYPLARVFGLCNTRGALRLAAVLSQGGEFAFVLFALVAREQIIDTTQIDRLILAVVISMMLTPVVYLIIEYVTGRTAEKVAAEYDGMEDEGHAVIIAGFGRVGQIVGRLLRVKGQSFTALEIDSSQVDVVRRYGSKVHFGDAGRLDLLRAAGAERAKLLVLAIDDIESSVRTAETVTRNFPHLTIIARARNRRHAHTLMDLGITHIFRETLFSSLAMSGRVLDMLGFDQEEVRRSIDTFREHDRRLLDEQHAIHHDEERLIQSAKDTARELESLLRNDSRD
ncbi:MAG: monovalent cation:proton antiporter-2 (CPA2) family protein [Proteobacteria bacterium]|nr:monovalent cation:proton antiporter-2 (CPA2) family protein [Pseudomonadota bacterium]